MEQLLLNKYCIEYNELYKQFLLEVEKGAEWNELRPIMQDMKRIDAFIEALRNSPTGEVVLDDSLPTSR
jgi:hypothetical protein